MALRLSPQRLAATVARSRQLSTFKPRFASSATATSNLPPNLKDEIEKEASLSNADPPSDSQTSRLVNEHLEYMVPTYVRPPPMFQKGEGCYLFDVENRMYLDMTAGIAVNALGHCDPEVTRTLSHQAQTLVHTSNLYHNPWTGALSQLLVQKTVESGAMKDASRAFICNSGSEANEAAIKFARKVGKKLEPTGTKHKLVSFHNSFHGRTMGALSATPNPKYQAPFGPMVPGFEYGTFNDIEGLDKLVTEETCGVLIEPIQGEGGVNVATPEFLDALRARCDEVGAVLIFDEIQCGLGRTGSLWAHASSGVHPDIMTTAKALGNGFPIGATIVTDAVSDKIVTGDHGTTFGGNPLGCRVAHHILTRLSSKELLSEIPSKERRFRAHFDRMRDMFPDIVKEVRGKGLLLGLQLASDPSPVVTAARERGVLVITCGTNTLRFVPPLVISEAEIDRGMEVLEEAMLEVFGKGQKVDKTPGQQEMGSR
ncbi:acetylornithine aminotransferas-like protein [Lineolata rhizophorae]|uniref:acetylornithine transaminase n=1 Tax=Lineolata rhizophorae TaxID=578093 RepID=A0A6A6PAT5_9PEZI|nr:acetylornithine aminotransferas-like protein [Lineolata rhizophorae]